MRKISLFFQRIKRKIYSFVLNQLKNPTFFWILITSFFRFFYFLFLKQKYIKRKNIKTNNLTICVGNITLGGNGKTPFLSQLVKDLKQFNPKIVSKGYKRKIRGDFQISTTMKVEDVGDEPLMLKKDFCELTVQLTESREKLLQNCHNNLIIFDDGLHEKNISYDFTIALFDHSLFFYPDYLLPTGVYRDLFCSIKDVDLIAIKGEIDLKKFDCIKGFFENKKIFKPIINFFLKPYSFIPVNNGVFCKKEKIAVFCGIGNPESFVKTLESLNLDIKEKLELSDHEKISKKEFYDWAVNSRNKGCKQIVCTKKDAIKLEIMENFPLPVFFLEIEFVIQNGQQYYEELVKKIIQKWLVNNS